MIGAFALSSLALSAQVSSYRAFGDGEKLVYAVSYKVSIVNTDVAEVSFHTTFNSSKETPVYKIDANGKTYPFYKWFFDLNDTYTSTLDSACSRTEQVFMIITSASSSFLLSVIPHSERRVSMISLSARFI